MMKTKFYFGEVHFVPRPPGDDVCDILLVRSVLVCSCLYIWMVIYCTRTSCLVTIVFVISGSEEINFMGTIQRKV